jgi:DsbC/DsbD-like thiol-disulfide interchange protein
MAHTGKETLTLKATGERLIRTILWVLVLSLTLAVTAWTQDSGPVVQTHAVMATDAAHADAPVKIAVVAQVAPGFHINDHKPSLDYLIPTQVKLDLDDQFTLKNAIYPLGTLKKLPFFDTPISVYEGNLVVGILLQAGKTVAPGTYSLHGKFAYQACNDHACLPPSSVPLAISIKVVPGNVPLKTVETDVFRRIKFQ